MPSLVSISAEWKVKLSNAILPQIAILRLITFLPCKHWTFEYVAKQKVFEMRSLQTADLSS